MNEINQYAAGDLQFKYEKDYPEHASGRPTHPHTTGTWDQPKTPKPATILDLFPSIDRWGIGVIDTLKYFKEISEAKPSYPPYNIIKDGFKWEVAVAVAGFTKDDLSVETAQATLVIRTNPKKDFEGKDVREVVHQGIAQRNFELQFALAEHVVVKSATLKDGLLVVKLEQELPESMKPKVIDIK